MAPIKFDNNIKNKLEKRTIQPSSDAWNTLSNQLDAADKKRTRTLFFYIGIAASIVGVVFVSTLFFKSSEEHSVLPTLVDTGIKEQLDDTETTINPGNKEDRVTISEDYQFQNDKNEIITPVVSSIKNEPKVANISVEKKTVKLKEKPIKTIETKVSITSIQRPVETQKEANILQALSFEDAKTIEVVAKIKSLELQNGTVADAEIEDLLKQAEKEILRQRIYDETTRTVNADALLQDVEADLEQSFRTRVFEALKSHSKSVLTAVTGRIK